jgi:hypothetical protein
MHRPFLARWAWLFLTALGIAALAIGAIAWLLPIQRSGEPGGAGEQAGLAPASAEAGSTHREPPLTEIEIHDVTAQTGITFSHTDGSSGRHYIMETVSAGLATLDYDGDGLIDVYFPNGAPLPGAKYDRPPRHALYRNLGGWRFQEVTEQAGVACTAYGLGVTVADYDNDGHPDLYLTNFGANVLYRNNGNGTFTDVTRQAGVAGLGKVGAGACFLDADGDGNLDLYVGNYLDFSYAKHVAVTVRGVPAYASPATHAPLPGILYHNNGDGTFTDVSTQSGIGQHASWGMGAVCADYDNDGHTDIFVANDVAANFLFQNNGRGTFHEVGTMAGTAYDVYGSPQGSMGVDCGDFNNDGLLDFYQTSYQLQHSVLYRNLGQGLFEDVSLSTGAGEGTYPHVTWGCGFVDFDNDGHRDLYVACGHLQDRVEEYDRTTAYRTHSLLLRNTGDGKFVDVSQPCGIRDMPVHSARGTAFDDLDNDGDIDVVVLNSRERATVLRNMSHELGGKNHWLQVRLQGVKTNRDGVGARVRVVAGDLTQIDEVHSGRGYQSHWGSRLHFGLGKHDRVERIEVHWIGGGVDVLENVPGDRLLKITEGTSPPL